MDSFIIRKGYTLKMKDSIESAKLPEKPTVSHVFSLSKSKEISEKREKEINNAWDELERKATQKALSEKCLASITTDTDDEKTKPEGIKKTLYNKYWRGITHPLDEIYEER